MARILVVDDEPDLRDVIAMALDRVGHDVVTVGDGASAIEMHASEDIDLLVTDLVMPDIDGIQVTRAVRASALSRTPILLVTASATPLDLAEAYAAGINGHVNKPFRIAELRDQVTALLERSHNSDAPPDAPLSGAK